MLVVLVVIGTLLLLYWGYGMLVRTPAAAEGGEQESRCHLCKREFPEREMVAREKEAGFVNFFCGECIEELWNDYHHLGEENND